MPTTRYRLEIEIDLEDYPIDRATLESVVELCLENGTPSGVVLPAQRLKVTLLDRELVPELESA